MKLFYKIILVTVISFFIIIITNECVKNKKRTEPDMKTITRCDDLEKDRFAGFVTIRGRLEKEYFTNKVGRKNYDITEWYLFLEDGCRIYLKDWAGLSDQFEKVRNQIVILTGMLRYGQIDSDDPNVQSRVGHMLYVKTLQPYKHNDGF